MLSAHQPTITSRNPVVDSVAINNIITNDNTTTNNSITNPKPQKPFAFAVSTILTHLAIVTETLSIDPEPGHCRHHRYLSTCNDRVDLGGAGGCATYRSSADGGGGVG